MVRAHVCLGISSLAVGQNEAFYQCMQLGGGRKNGERQSLVLGAFQPVAQDQVWSQVRFWVQLRSLTQEEIVLK